MRCGRTPLLLCWSLLGRDRNVLGTTDHTADFFAAKVNILPGKIQLVLSLPPVFVPASSSLSSFRLCTEIEVRRIVMSSPVQSSSLDPIPTFLVCEFIDVLLPYITKMINTSLAQGRLPSSQKHAIVTPLLKKPGLDTADLGNYHPISNLSFMSKVVERAVAYWTNIFWLTTYCRFSVCL